MNVIEMLNVEELVDIIVQVVIVVRWMGYILCVVLVFYFMFGQFLGECLIKVCEVIELFNKCKVNFEYEGEMLVLVVLCWDVIDMYFFSCLMDIVNVLVMLVIYSVSIFMSIVEELGGCIVIGFILVGFN